jgi:hypothetical protein
MTQVAWNMIHSYLCGYADNVIRECGAPPSDLSRCDDMVEIIREDGERFGDLSYLKLGFEHVLAGSDESLLQYRTDVVYPWKPKDLRRVFEYAYKYLWPDELLPTRSPPELELINVDGATWKRIKDEQARR